MNFLFDANLPPRLARAIAELSNGEPDVGEVVGHRQKFPKAADRADEVWLPQLIAAGDWCVVSIDRFNKSSAERELMQRRGLLVFVLDAQWGTQRYWPQAARFVLWWPKMLGAASYVANDVLSVPWRYTGQSKFRSLIR